MLDDVFYTDDLPQFDQYDDDYVLQTEANLADKSTASLWEEELHFQQLEYSEQLMHISYDNDGESAANFEISERSLPFCFDSCQFMRDNFHAIKKNCQQVLIWTILRAMKTLFKTFHIQICSPRMPLVVKLQIKTWKLEHILG